MSNFWTFLTHISSFYTFSLHLFFHRVFLTNPRRLLECFEAHDGVGVGGGLVSEMRLAALLIWPYQISEIVLIKGFIIFLCTSEGTMACHMPKMGDFMV